MRLKKAELVAKCAEFGIVQDNINELTTNQLIALIISTAPKTIIEGTVIDVPNETLSIEELQETCELIGIQYNLLLQMKHTLKLQKIDHLYFAYTLQIMLNKTVARNKKKIEDAIAFEERKRKCIAFKEQIIEEIEQLNTEANNCLQIARDKDTELAKFIANKKKELNMYGAWKAWDTAVRALWKKQKTHNYDCPDGHDFTIHVNHPHELFTLAKEDRYISKTCNVCGLDYYYVKEPSF